MDPDVDEARVSLFEDLVYSQQLAKTGYVKGVGAATRSKSRRNLTGDPYFTDGYRAVLVFDDWSRSFIEIVTICLSPVPAMANMIWGMT